MTRYKKEVKQAACNAALKGIHLKQVQAQFGPNPKAVMRYLKKQGIDYKKLKEQLKPKTVIQINKEKQIFKVQNKKKHTPLVVPHTYLEEGEQ